MWSKALKNWVKKFADMDKCHQDISCQDKCYHDSRHLSKIVPGTLPLKFSQNCISNSGDIAHITNVARIYVSGKNVTMRIGFCKKGGQEETGGGRD